MTQKELMSQEEMEDAIRRLAYLLDDVKAVYRTLIFCKQTLENNPFQARLIAGVCGNCAYNLGQHIHFCDPSFEPEKI